MAKIDTKVYKLDIYDMKVSNNLYRCADDEKHCKSMVKKLVFYDRDQVLKMHADSISLKGVDYDISTLTPIPFLGENEQVERIIPLDGHWLGVFFKDKTTGKVKENKVMYISNEGDGYISDDVSPALNGCVAKSIYLRHLEEDPISYARLPDKYFDGTHDDFLSEFFGKTRKIVTRFLVSLIKNDNNTIKITEFKLKEDIRLEDIREAIMREFSKKVKSDDFETYKLLDMLYTFFHGDKIISLSNRYSESGGLGQCDHKEKQ